MVCTQSIEDILPRWPHLFLLLDVVMSESKAKAKIRKT